MKVANLAAAQAISNSELGEAHQTGKSNASGLAFAPD